MRRRCRQTSAANSAKREHAQGLVRRHSSLNPAARRRRFAAPPACRHRRRRPSPISTSMTVDALGFDQMARAGVAFELRDRGKQRARQDAPDCRACRHGWRARPRVPPDCAKASISRSRSAGETPGMSPSTISAPAASSGSAAMPAFSELARPAAKSRIVRRTSTSSPASAARDALGLMAGDDHDRRLRPAGERRARRCGAPAACRRTAPAACSARPCGWTAGGEHARHRPSARPRLRSSSRGCGRVGISISRPPTPMPAMSPSVTSSPAISRSSTQSKPFSLGLRAQPGAPMHRLAAELAEHQQIAGIDRHAGAHDRRRRPAGSRRE